MQRITITYKLCLKRTKVHRAGIHVDRGCPQWKMSAPLKEFSATLQSYFTEWRFKTIPINKLQYGSEATFPISQSQRRKECMWRVFSRGHFRAVLVGA